MGVNAIVPSKDKHLN